MEDKFQIEKMFGKFIAGFEVPAMAYYKDPSLPNKTNFGPRPTDIVVSGPLKTGTTWVQQILHQMRTGGDEDFESLFDVSWWIPFFFMENPTGFDYTADQPASPRVFKSHAPYERLDKVEGMKFIAVMRDPMDATWSAKKFLAGLYGFDRDSEFGDKIIEYIIDSTFARTTGGFPQLSSWYPHLNDPDVFPIFFEDLKADLPECIKRLSEFTGLQMDDDLFDLVLERSSFKYMSKNSKKFMPTYKMFGSVLGIDEDLFKPTVGMVRENGGQTGEAAKEKNEKIENVIMKLWHERYEPVCGHKNFQELYDHVSFLRN